MKSQIGSAANTGYLVYYSPGDKHPTFKRAGVDGLNTSDAGEQQQTVERALAHGVGEGFCLRDLAEGNFGEGRCDEHARAVLLEQPFGLNFQAALEGDHLKACQGLRHSVLG